MVHHFGIAQKYHHSYIMDVCEWVKAISLLLDLSLLHTSYNPNAYITRNNSHKLLIFVLRLYSNLIIGHFERRKSEREIEREATKGIKIVGHIFLRRLTLLERTSSESLICEMNGLANEK